MDRRWVWRRMSVVALLICLLSGASIRFTVYDNSGSRWFASASESELAEESEESFEETSEIVPEEELNPEGRLESTLEEELEPEEKSAPVLEEPPTSTGGAQPMPSDAPAHTPADGTDESDVLAENPLVSWLMGATQVDGFTVTIPANVSANNGQLIVSCEMSGTSEVNVYLASANNFSLKLGNGSESVSYTLEGKDDIRFTESGNKILTLSVTGTPRYAGTYTDTLTFTVTTE